MERKYEVMFILRPDVAAEEADKLIASLESTIQNGGGKLLSSEKLGNRKLAYTVRKFNEGSYNLLVVEAGGDLVAELERRLRVAEPVIKYITVRVDEEEKRTEKLRKHRAAHVKQSEVEAQAAAKKAAEEAAANQAAANEAAASRAAEEQAASGEAAPNQPAPAEGAAAEGSGAGDTPAQSSPETVSQ